jgi:hypothetical protein
LESDENDLTLENLMSLLDNSITQLPFGLNDQGQALPLGQIPFTVKDFAQFGCFLDEFNRLPVDDIDYAITLTATGTFAMNTTLTNGQLNVSTPAAADAVAMLGLMQYRIQKAANPSTPGKKFAARFKFRLGTTAFLATVLGVGFGNASAVTAAGITDGFILTKADASANLVLSVRAASATVASATIGTATSGLDVVLDLYFDGIDRLYYGIAGTAYAGYLTVTTAPAVVIRPFFHQIGGALAGATTVSVIDTIFAANER